MACTKQYIWSYRRGVCEVFDVDGNGNFGRKRGSYRDYCCYAGMLSLNIEWSMSDALEAACKYDYEDGQCRKYNRPNDPGWRRHGAAQRQGDNVCCAQGRATQPNNVFLTEAC